MSFDLMFHKANNLYLDGAYAQAEQIYRQLLEFVPESSDVLNMLGLTAQQQGLHNEAVSFFYQSLKTASNKLPIYFNLAVSLTALSHFRDALEIYQKILDIKPDIKEVYNNLGWIYENLQDNDNALHCYNKAIELDYSYTEARLNKALLENNENALNQLVQEFPKNSLVLYHQALRFFDNQQNEKALHLALKADQIEQSYDIKNLIAQIFLKQENFEKSEQYFLQALSRNPKGIDALLNLGQLQKEERYFKKALSLYPQSFEAHILYADFLYQDKRNVEALEEYRKAVLISPDNPALSNNIALILKDQGDYQGALDLLMDAFLKNPHDDKIAINISETLILLYQNNADEALKIAKLWQQNAQDNIFANKLLASFEHKSTEDTVEYAQKLFDEFAQTYEQRMQEINYNIFNKIKELNINFNVKVLDLGCGTGLAAKALKTSNSSWTGVDISEKMLQKAKEKNIYQTLHHANIFQFIKENKLNYNIILLLDVIEYTKETYNIFKYLYPARLILSFETAHDNIETFEISEQGRYKHNPHYVESQLKKAGYKNIKQYPLILRQECGQPLKGFLFDCY